MKNQFKSSFESNKNRIVKTRVFDIKNIHGNRIIVIQRRCLISVDQIGSIPHYTPLKLYKGVVLCESAMIFTEGSFNKLKEIIKDF